MRAVVFLSLLHAAFVVDGQYSWNGPSRDVPLEDPNAGNACGTDASSCGCCVMVRELYSLKAYFDKTLTELEKEYSNTKQSLNTTEASRVAFSVSLYRDGNFMCNGPYSYNTVVIYKHVFLNVGGAYSVSTGIFTVPLAGVYSLALSIYSDAGSPGNLLAACATLQVNGQLVAGVRDQNTNDQEDSTTLAVALHLKVGDRVTVNLNKGCFLCDDNNHYNTFSAFLLYPE